MAVALIVIGIIVALLLNLWVGLVLVLIGVVLLFVPAAPYGPGWGRRGPP